MWFKGTFIPTPKEGLFKFRGEGEGGSKATICKEKYEAKLDSPEAGGGKSKIKKMSMRGVWICLGTTN